MPVRGRTRRRPSSQTTPGAPPTFGTAPGAGPEVTPATFAEAEKLAQVTMTAAEREMAAASWRRSMASLPRAAHGTAQGAARRRRRAGNAMEPGAARTSSGPARDAFVRSTDAGAPLPASDADIAFAPVTQLSRWIEQTQAHLRAAHEHLPRAHRAARSEDPLRHHAHEGLRARAGEEGRRGNCRGQVSRAAARHSVRRQGPARHGGHRDDVRRGAIQESRAGRGLRGRCTASTRPARSSSPS